MALKLSRPVVYSLLGVVVLAAAYFLNEPTQSARKGRSAAAKPKTTSKKDQFLPEDYDAKFTPVNWPVKDTFQPVVARKDTRSLLSNPGGIPVEFAGGDPNWVYTGEVSVDGSREALLENTLTGEGVFLRSGERWKNCAVVEIAGEKLRLEGPGGEVKTVTLGDRQAAVNPGAELAPVNPAPGAPLTGPIGGGGLTITPDPNVQRNNRRSQSGN